MSKETQIEKTAPTSEATTKAAPQVDADFNNLLAKEKSLELSSFNHETYDQLFRLAEVMADTGVVPDSLRTEGTKGNKKDLPRERVVANCFLVAEQAHRWQMSPFTILGEAAIVRGKLGWEGKTINALIQKFAGVYLKFEYNDKSGDDMTVTVSGTLPNETEPRTVPGTVKSWKTTGDGSPWIISDDITLKRQLSYRGAREWMRVHLPSVMHGVLAIDEIQDFSNKEPAPIIRENPLNKFADTPQVATESEPEPEPAKPLSKRDKMIAEIKVLADKLGKTEGDWKVVLDHYKASCLEDMKDIELRSILAKLKKEQPEELSLKGSDS